MGQESTPNAGNVGLISRLGRSSREGDDNPLQYSCLKNPMDRGAWWATVQWVAEYDTTEQLSNNSISLKALSPGRVTVGIEVSTHGLGGAQFSSLQYVVISWLSCLI